MSASAPVVVSAANSAQVTVSTLSPAVRSVIVLAAGQGTRMKSRLPKVLHPLSGRSLLGHAIAAAADLKPENLVVVVRHERQAVAAEAKRCYPAAIIVDQDEIPGTGRAVQCGLEGAAAAGFPLRGTVFVTSGDVPLLTGETLAQLGDLHERVQAAVSLVTTIVADPTGYGRVVRGADGQVAGIVEHRDASPAQREIQEINAGIYAFDADFLRESLSLLDQNNDQGEVYLTDLVAIAVRAEKPVQALILEDTWQAAGCNDRAQLADLRAELNRRICRAHQLNGVSILAPQTTSIDVMVQIERDAVIYPCTQVEGYSRIGEGAQIGPNSMIRNAIIGDAAVIPHGWIEGVTIASGQTLPPFTVDTAGVDADARSRAST